MTRRAASNPPRRPSILARRKRGAAAMARVLGVAVLTVALLAGEGNPDLLRSVISDHAQTLLALCLGGAIFLLLGIVRSARPTDATRRGFDVIASPPPKVPPK